MPVPNGLGIDLDALANAPGPVLFQGGAAENFFSPEEAMMSAVQPRVQPVSPETSQQPLGGAASFDLVNPVQSITLAMFWPGDEPLDGMDAMVNNVQYVFAPKAVTRIGPKMEHQRNAQHKIMPHLPLRVVPNVGSPDQIATELLRRNEDKGLILLYSDGNDTARAQAGRKLYLVWRRRQAQTLVEGHLQRCEAAMAQGRPAPPMPHQIRRAQEFLNFHDAELHDRKRYVVQIDGTDFDDADQAWGYVKRMFPNSWDDPKAVLDLQTNANAARVETSDAPQRIVAVPQMKVSEQRQETTPEQVKLAVLRERATYVLARAGGEGIILGDATREGLRGETDPALLEIHIQDAMATINGPDQSGA